jgi:methylmalonyl-CoA mutase cobalamin-binding subunit
MIEQDVRPKKDAPLIVCACPTGEEHEGALLSFSAHATRQGLRVVYLGPNTPVGEILSVAEKRDARIVAVSLTRAYDRRGIDDLLRSLLAWKHGKPGRHVIAGGASALAHGDALRAEGMVVADSVRIDLASLCQEPA